MSRITPILLVTLALIFAACEQDPNSSDAANFTDLSMKSKTTPVVGDAHPAWVFQGSTTIKVKGSLFSYPTLAVSDSDGTDEADIYTGSSNSEWISTPTWSPTGTSVSFGVGPSNNGWGSYAIKAIDVSVSGGSAVGSNTRTIYSASTSDSLKILGQAWCPASGVNLIAFIGYRPGEWGVYTVSTSGGTATKIYSLSASGGSFDWPYDITWSSDGTQLAFAEVSSTSTYSIKVISSTGSVNATLVSGTYADIDRMQWSNTGKSEIAFSARAVGVAHARDIYTIGTTSGSTATLLVAGETLSADQWTVADDPFWSPDNSEIIYTKKSYSYGSGTGISTHKITVGTGATTNLGMIAYGDWKTP